MACDRFNEQVVEMYDTGEEHFKHTLVNPCLQTLVNQYTGIYVRDNQIPVWTPNAVLRSLSFQGPTIPVLVSVNGLE